MMAPYVDGNHFTWRWWENSENIKLFCAHSISFLIAKHDVDRNLKRWQDLKKNGID